MISFFTQIGFLNPWALSALLALPVLWFILRVIPPAPRRILFAPFRFLQGLTAQTKTPSHTPWWILLLRLLILACLMIGFARPVFRLSKDAPVSAPLLLIVENGWEAAPNWKGAQEQARNIIGQTARAGNPVYLLPTAPTADHPDTPLSGPLSGEQARAQLAALSPQPWPSDFKQANATLKKASLPDNLDIFWVGTGGFTARPDGFISALSALGNKISYTSCPVKSCALLLKTSQTQGEYIIEQIAAPSGKRSVFLDMLAKSGQRLHSEKVDLTAKQTFITLKIPPDLKDKSARIEIRGTDSAGSVLLLPGEKERKTVGLISAKGLEETKPYIDGLFYLERALSPYAEIEAAPLSDLLTPEKGTDVLIAQGPLHDQVEIRTKLQNWIEDGGVLLRFAGESLQQSPDDPFLPVKLRQGERALDGALTWEKPRTLYSFKENTPLSGLAANETITVNRQILADPAFSLENKIWATLDDGTPLITARQSGSGWIILIHTSAAPGWSNLPLSGLYVSLLQRIIGLSSKSAQTSEDKDSYLLSGALNAKGSLEKPKIATELSKEDFLTALPSAKAPPGLYTQNGTSWPRSLGNHLEYPQSAKNVLPSTVKQLEFSGQTEKDLTALFVAASFILFLIDWLIMIALSRPQIGLGIKGKTALIILALTLFTSPAFAQTQDSDLKYANALYLAYLKTGHPETDDTARRGLHNLARALSERTSIEPGGVAALNPEKDTMAFFPFLYWPLGQSIPELSEKALANLRSYIAHGGTLFIDTQDGQAQFAFGKQQIALRNLAAALDFPSLRPVPKDHVLNKSFYLLQDQPGRYANAPLWVASDKNESYDGVSGVIIGGNDWAYAWSHLREADALNPILTGISRRDEMALRFGINLTMYTLTGTYKADQVHLSHILKRLGN